MPSIDTLESTPGEVRAVTLASDQCLDVHLPAGSRVHVAQGRVTVAGAPRWLAEQTFRVSQDVGAGGVCVIDAAGWHQIMAKMPAHLRIIAPAARPRLWRLIKSRFGRSGLLPGHSRPPDTQAAEQSVPHATSQ